MAGRRTRRHAAPGVIGDEGGAPDRHRAALDPAVDSGTGGLVHVLGRGERQPARRCRDDEGAGDDMVRGLVEGGREAEDLVGRHVAGGHHGRNRRVALGDGPGLVEDERPDPGEHLQRPAALDEDAAARRPRDAGDDGDGHGEDQRAGGRHHEHREPADRIAGEEPGPAGDRHRHRQEEEGEAVGEPYHGRLRPLGRLHHPDDAGIGALRRRTRHREVERLAGIGRTALDGLAAHPADRDRLAGERREVEHRRLRGDGAVGGDHLAAADEEPVAFDHRVDGHLLEDVAAPPHRGLRRALEKGGHLAPGAAGGARLEELPARIHQRHHGAGEGLVEDEGASHGDEGDDVEADLGAGEAHGDLDREGDDHRQGRGGEERRAELRPAGEMGESARGQPERRHGDEKAADEDGRADRAHSGIPPGSGSIGRQPAFRTLTGVNRPEIRSGPAGERGRRGGSDRWSGPRRRG